MMKKIFIFYVITNAFISNCDKIAKRFHIKVITERRNKFYQLHFVLRILIFPLISAVEVALN